MVDQLKALVSRYVSGEIGYADFRQVFVPEFLSALKPGDDRIDRLVREIESVCAQFENDFLDEQEAKVEIETAACLTTVIVTYFTSRGDSSEQLRVLPSSSERAYVALPTASGTTRTRDEIFA